MEKNKNIWLLPTDKPSRLHFNEFEELLFTPKYEKLEGVNIYITNDEEIKDCYVINTQTNKIYFENWYSSNPFIKKIILTTDLELQKDDVQAIDDEFLEWFVKNPSCEEIEVRFFCCGQIDGKCNPECLRKFYEIIIPKEEPKQEYSNSYNEEDDKLRTHIVKKYLDSKQETLEEDYHIFLQKKYNNPYLTNNELHLPSFEFGAKWQMDKQDNFAVGFAEWSVARALGCDTFTINKDELNIYKKYINTLNGN